ncbi:hypothetical protein M8C21_028805, partial [Ambrosia artemisiifolia]
MVGFVPRIHLINQSLETFLTDLVNMYMKENGNSYVYVDGGLKYLRMYTNEMPVSLLEYDIATSFLVANETIPLLSGQKIYEIGLTGNSCLVGHSNKRTECVNRFVSEFGRMPLVPTSVKAVDSRDTWF